MFFFCTEGGACGQNILPTKVTYFDVGSEGLQINKHNKCAHAYYELCNML